jgi:hypothetical protein
MENFSSAWCGKISFWWNKNLLRGRVEKIKIRDHHIKKKRKRK